MKSQYRTLVTLLLAVLVASCSHVAPRYSISANNVEGIRTVSSDGTNKIGVASFSTFEPGLSSIMCRGAGPVRPPDDLTFEKYIEEAIASELKLARAFSSESPVRLQGKLEYITFNSNIFNGKWQIDMTFSGDSVEPFTIKSIYEFSTNYVANTACTQVATALPQAVQELVAKLVSHPSFRKLVTKK
jgi:hypothetical protein